MFIISLFLWWQYQRKKAWRNRLTHTMARVDALTRCFALPALPAGQAQGQPPRPDHHQRVTDTGKMCVRCIGAAEAENRWRWFPRWSVSTTEAVAYWSESEFDAAMAVSVLGIIL